MIPPLTADEYERLERNIAGEGCRDAVVVWADNGKAPVILDGHNRYEICCRLSIPFQVSNRILETRQDAKIWVINNQFGRRNLSAYQRSVLALKLEDVLKEKGIQKMAAGGGDRKSAGYRSGCPTLDNPIIEKKQGVTEAILPVLPKIDTKKELARVSGVSHGTMAKVKKIEEKATPEQKSKLTKGETSINDVWKSIRKNENKEDKQKRALQLKENDNKNIHRAWHNSAVRHSGGCGGGCFFRAHRNYANLRSMSQRNFPVDLLLNLLST